MLGDFTHGPDPLRVGAGDVVHRGPARIVLNVTNLLVQIVGREIDAGPARHQCECALVVDMAAVVGEFRLCLGFRPPENNREHAEHQDFSRVAAHLGCEFTNGGNARRDNLGRWPRHEHALGVRGSELPSAWRSARLIEHRRPLWRRFTEMDRVEAVVSPRVLHPMHFRGIGENPARAVAQDRIVLPASFPELVNHFHIFIGHVVAVVMPGLLFLARAARGAVEIAGHDVPSDPPLGEVIERRHAPRKSVGRLVGQVRRDAEAQILRDRGHCRNQQQRIVGRRLGGVAQRGVRTAAEHVIDAEHIGEKQAVEPAALQRFCEIDPVRQAIVVGGPVARMGPQARRLMRHAVHRKRVEPYLFFHQLALIVARLNRTDRRTCCIRTGFGKPNCGRRHFRPKPYLDTLASHRQVRERESKT